MELSIGKKIKTLRQQKELTQDELATHLGISFQSVSKWERGDGYPDITLLPALARYFGITVDELIGVEEWTSRENYRDILQKWEENNRLGHNRENVELMRNSLRDYPNDSLLLVKLSTSLEKVDGSAEEKEKYLRESIAVQEQIIRYAADCEVRGATLFNICFAYRKNGDDQKALEQAKKLPSLLKGRENALIYFLEGEEKREVARSAIMPLVWSFCHQLCALAETEQDMDYLDKADTILDMFYRDDDGRFATEARKKVAEYRAKLSV